MKSLAERALQFEKFLDDSRDADGLVYSVLNTNGLRPWRNSDVEGKGYDLWDHWAGDFAGAANYEDCIMATGRYIVAKVLKHSATGGDAAALADAERSVKALLAVSREGDKIESGYLPKPYGGLRNASKSRNISTDQYEHALFALWHFRQACPNSPIIPEIESAIARWAGYFVRHDFAYEYYGRARVEVEGSVHGLGFYLPLMAIAHRMTGKPEYAQAMKQRLLPLVGKHLVLKEDSPKWLAHPNVTNLIVTGLQYCWQNGLDNEECRHAMGQWARLGVQWLSKDRLTFCFAEGSDTDPVPPHYIQIEGEPPLNLKFLLWRSNVKGADSCKIAHTIMLAHPAFPDAGWRDQALDLLDRFQDVREFRHYLDPDGTQLPPEYAYMNNMLSTEFMSAWLQVYYLDARGASRSCDRVGPGG